jgi:DNA-binding transcriptional LysR family regulator
MELRHLRYFREVARELHFTRAARNLGISQPPLTQQIQNLERELGQPLFERAGRGVALTEAGRVFLQDADAILSLAKTAAERVAGVGVGRSGRLRVGFTESSSFNPIVTGALRRFRTAYPGVDLELKEGQSTRLAADILANELDLAFVRPPLVTGAHLELKILAHEPMVAAVPTDHPLASRSRLKLRDLQGERLICYPRASGRGLSDEVIEALRSSGHEPVIVQQTPQLSSTVNLVAAGLGIAVVPACLQHIHPQSVRYLPIEDLKMKARLAVLHGVGQPSAAQSNFLALARASARSE